METAIYSSDGYLLGRVTVEDDEAICGLVTRFHGPRSPRSVYLRIDGEWSRWTFKNGLQGIEELPEAVASAAAFDAAHRTREGGT